MNDFSSLAVSAVASLGNSLRAWLQSALLGDTNRPIRIEIGSSSNPLSGSLAVHSFQATESICAERPLCLRVVCLAAQNDLSPKQFLGQPIRLALVNDSGELRTFSAIITHAQSAPDDGSGAQPWLLEAVDAMTLMRQGSKSRLFLRKSLIEIATVVLREWSDVLGDTFDVDMQNLQVDRYPTREMTIQWNESDTAFLQRLFRKHGIAWAVKTGDSDDSITHTLVLFDNPDLLPRNSADTLRYHVDAASQEHDAITVWSPVGRVTPGTVEGQSWDYKSQRSDQRHSLSLIDFGDRGGLVAGALLDARVDPPHWADDGDDYSRLGDIRMQYHEMQAALVQGASSARDITVMTRVTVEDRPGVTLGQTRPDNPYDYSGSDDNGSDDYLFLHVEHWGQNNLPKDLADWLQILLAANGWTWQAPAIGHYDAHRRYANTFVAIAQGMPIVPRFDPVQDWPVLPPLTGIVVCPASEEVYCDEFGRVYVQFPGLRTEDHEHAGGAGTTNSPADSAAIRVAMPAANPGAGMIQLPRRGDEVLITFVGGDPDKPLITHSIHSPVNVPTSFYGINTLPGNRYLSGNRSQEVFGNEATHIQHDNTPQQTSLQVHSDHVHSQLTLGYLTTPRIEGDATPRGEGAELRTDGAAAVRAAQGLLLSAWARLQASGHQLDVQEAQSVMQMGMDLFKCMGEYAAKHQGFPLKLDEQHKLADTVAHWEDGSNTQPDKTLQATGIVSITAPEGIAHTTPQTLMHTAGKNIDAVAMHDVQQVAGHQMLMQAGKGMSLFAHNGGIQLVGHKGDVKIQSQSNTTYIEAAQDIDIIAKGNIRICGNQIEVIAQDGSFVQFGGGITLGTNDAIQEHAASFSHESAATRTPSVPSFPHEPFNDKYRLINRHTGEPMRNTPYAVMRADGTVEHGTTDGDGQTHLLTNTIGPEVVDIYAKPLMGGQSTPTEQA